MIPGHARAVFVSHSEKVGRNAKPVVLLTGIVEV